MSERTQSGREYAFDEVVVLSLAIHFKINFRLSRGISAKQYGGQPLCRIRLNEGQFGEYIPNKTLKRHLRVNFSLEFPRPSPPRLLSTVIISDIP